MMYRRPDSVTGAGIIVCVFAVLSGLSSLLGLSAQDGLESTADIANKVVELGAGIAMLVACVHLLRGENWARWFYLALCGALFAFDVAFLRDQLYTFVPLATVRLISIALLFLPNANKYYASAEGRWE